jgi:hypothetical protein
MVQGARCKTKVGTYHGMSIIQKNKRTVTEKNRLLGGKKIRRKERNN